MSTRKIASLGVAALVAVAVAGISGQSYAGSVTFEIKVDTSGLVQGPGGLIDISLSPSIPQSPATVSIRVYNPTTDGTLGTAFNVSGNATGDLTTLIGVTADNSTVPNELQQDFSVKSFFDVFVTLSGSEIGPGASGPWSGTVFQFSIFDSQVNGNYLWGQGIVNPDVDQDGNPIVNGVVQPIKSGPPVQIIQLAVPEPSSLVLMSVGIGAVVAIGRRRPMWPAA